MRWHCQDKQNQWVGVSEDSHCYHDDLRETYVFTDLVDTMPSSALLIWFDIDRMTPVWLHSCFW